MSKPDTNQASEYKLMSELGFRYVPREGGYYIHKFVKNQENPSSLNSVLMPEVAKQIASLIRTEKLKLLAEVRGRVVGENEPEFNTPKPEIGNMARNRLREAQADLLTKLEANQ